MTEKILLRNKDNPLYATWCTMKARCNRKTHKKYPIYGGRGIKVCEEWNKADGFKSFYTWAIQNGWDKGLTLDRIDNDGDYTPTNCRWVTLSVQNNNKRNNHNVIYNGSVFTIAQLARLFNIDYGYLRTQISSKGLPVKKAIEKSLQNGKPFNGTGTHKYTSKIKRRVPHD